MTKLVVIIYIQCSKSQIQFTKHKLKLLEKQWSRNEVCTTAWICNADLSLIVILVDANKQATLKWNDTLLQLIHTVSHKKLLAMVYRTTFEISKMVYLELNMHVNITI